MSDAELLASTKCGSVVAAAGCGKTELIASAVARTSGRQLVLTHTNAGVEALRRRLRRFGVSQRQVAVDTIAGWSLKYIVSYPQRSGGMPTKSDGLADWGAIYPTMERLLDDRMITRILSASYEGVFVDEYQDCDEPQHRLVSKLLATLPVRILGDPLQAVFRFRGDPPPWLAQVEAVFPRVLTLTWPWRWRRTGENAELGDWLSAVRTTLESRSPVSFSGAPIRFVQLTAAGRWQSEAAQAAFNAADTAGTAVAIFKWPGGYQLLGKLTAGRFQCVEPIDARDAASMLEALDAMDGERRLQRLVEFVRGISVNNEEPLAEVIDLTHARAPERPPSTAAQEAARFLTSVRDGGTPGACGDALDALSHLPGIKVYRRELLWAAVDSLRDVGSGPFSGLLTALRHRRNLTSHVGRRLARCTTGSTLLLKGMEFDHAVVVDSGEFTVNDLYVALTRGSKSLTVLSATATIDPRTMRRS